MQISVSIIIPLYNKANCIGATIESVLAQRYGNFELLIVDDGSTDKSSDEVKTFSDPRIKYFYKSNGGVSSARNFGIDNAGCEWIMFLDADDTLEPDCLSTLLRPIELGAAIDISTSNFYEEKNGIKKCVASARSECIVPNNYKWLFFNKFRLRAGSFLIKKNVVQRFRFNEAISRFEDMECILAWIREAKIHTSTPPVMTYKTDNCSLSRIAGDCSRDYTFLMTFEGKSFWEKCQLGKLLYLGWIGYPDKRHILIKKYWRYTSYAVIAKTQMLISHLTK